jgi:hypothetical protein
MVEIADRPWRFRAFDKHLVEQAAKSFGLVRDCHVQPCAPRFLLALAAANMLSARVSPVTGSMPQAASSRSASAGSPSAAISAPLRLVSAHVRSKSTSVPSLSNRIAFSEAEVCHVMMFSRLTDAVHRDCMGVNSMIEQRSRSLTQRPAPYDSLLDPEIWAFVDRSRRLYPDEATGLTLPGQRRVYDACARHSMRGGPSGVSVAIFHPGPLRADSACVNTCRPAAPGRYWCSTCMAAASCCRRASTAMTASAPKSVSAPALKS